MRWPLTASVGVCLVLAVTDAWADPEADAKDLFDRGHQLRASGDCASAAPLFHKAHDIFPSALGPLRNAAECEESMGRWASARRSWLDLKRALLLSQEAKYKGWDADAEDAARRLVGRVAHLTVDVATRDHDIGKLEVTVNGEALAPPLVGTTLDRDPGHYVIRAQLGNGAPAEQTIDLVTGETREVRLVVAPLGEPNARRDEKPSPVRSHETSVWTPAGWVTLSVGLGAFVGMAIAIGVRQDALSTLTTQCAGYASMPCPSSLKPVVDRGDAASTAATVLAVAGGVVSGAGILMLVVGAVTPHRERSVALGVAPVQGGWAAVLSGSFK
jgi:hypothetical protein